MQPFQAPRLLRWRVLAGTLSLSLSLSLAWAAAAQPSAAVNLVPASAACDKPVYLTFDTGSMDVAPLVAVVLQRQQVRATFFAGMHPTASGDSLDASWAPWWKARAAEGHAFAARTRDEVVWVGDANARDAQFIVRPTQGAFAGRTFTWPAAKYCENITATADRLAHVTGERPLPLYRAAGGKGSPRLQAAAKACGYTQVSGQAPGFASGAPQAKDPTDAQITQAVARVRAGDVLAVPLGAWSRQVPQVPVGLDQWIAGLKAQGFCFATLREHPDYGATTATRP